MTYYRIFPLDQAGHVCGRIELEFASDVEAFAHATKAIGEATPEVEVWIGTKCIGRVSASVPAVFFTDKSIIDEA